MRSPTNRSPLKSESEEWTSKDEAVQSVSDGKDDDDLEEEYEVERVIDHKKKRDGTLSFLLLWKGYPESDATWQDESDLNCDNLIAEYFSQKGLSRDDLKVKSRKSKRLEKNTKSLQSKRVKKNTSKSSLDMEVSLTLVDPHNVQLLKEETNWNEVVDYVTTLERDEKNELFVHLQLRNGELTICPSHIVRKRCPELLLDFYENNLKFRKSDD
ncbi:Chromobox protein 1 [Coelomomyces lativittatus]|nr:Chromobox protein 1 [Coelomomyces lativittatus]KAJ1504412.1 Chromobox protein 1 [Coelomomyces lativittatus]